MKFLSFKDIFYFANNYLIIYRTSISSYNKYTNKNMHFGKSDPLKYNDYNFFQRSLFLSDLLYYKLVVGQYNIIKM